MKMRNKVLLLSLLCCSTAVQAQKVQVLLGDVNNDGEVTVADVSTLVGYLKDNSQPLPNPDGADANQDYNIDVDDVSAIADLVLKKEKKYIEYYEYNGHRCVDLGLGVKWATCNVGASKPEECGDYFAWGETEPKESYNWSTYKWMQTGKAAWNYVTKYTVADNQTDGIWYSGSSFVGDGKTQLDPEDDAAHVNWQGDWRMPTEGELEELRTYCEWTWISVNDQNGYKVVGPNGNSIFLPASGFKENKTVYSINKYADYWSKSLDSTDTDYAYFIYFNTEYVFYYYYFRYTGQSVRPVIK